MSRHESGTFSEALSEAVSRRRLSLEALSHQLRALGTPVSIATLSYWQTGRSLPARASSLEAVGHLEGLLDLSPGALLRTLPQVDVDKLWNPQKVIAAEELVQAALDELGLALDKGFTRLAIHDTVRVSADGLVLTQTTHTLARTTDEGLDRYPIMAAESTDEGYAPPRLEAVRGCTMGRLREVEEANTAIGELLLGRTLDRDEMVAFSHRTTWRSPSTPDTVFQRVISLPVHHLSMTITFEGTPPSTAWRTTLPSSDAPEDELVRTPLPTGRTLQVALANVRPAVHGIHWELPGDGGLPEAGA